MHPESEARLQRERDFHNERFDGEDNRFEQKKYYWAIQDGAETYLNRVEQEALGVDVLEYGCGDAENFQRISPVAHTLTGIDISDSAIERLRDAQDFTNTHYEVMDAQNMTFADQSFDLVFGSGIIHHLDTRQSAVEISRVLRPGGKAIFWEPLGLNPLINAYRLMTPSARTPDEHPLMPHDFRIYRDYFGKVDLTFYGLTTLGAVPFRNKDYGSSLFGVTRAIDQTIMSIPGLRFLAWYCLMVCREPISRTH